MGKLVIGYYKNGERHEYGGKLYTSTGQNTNGTMTQKAFSEAVGSIIDEIIGVEN